MTTTKRFVRPSLPLLLILLTGCPTRYAPPKNPITDPHRILHAITEHGKRIETLDAESRVEFYSTRGAQKGQVTILMQKPENLHFQAHDLGGNMLSILISNGTTFWSYVRGESECYTGKPCPDNLARLLPIILSGTDVANLLIGTPPMIGFDEATVEFNTRTGRYDVVLTTKHHDLEQRLSCQVDTLAVHQSVIKGDKGLVLGVRYSEWRDIGGTRLPSYLRFRMQQDDIDLSIEYRDVKANQPVSDKAFRFTCPGGTQEKELQCSQSRPAL